MPTKDIIRHESLGADVLAFTTTRAVGREREKLCQIAGVDDSRLIVPHQTHGDKILCVDAPFLALSADAQREALEGIDAVWTREKKLCIGVSTADCVPLLLCDETQGTVAAIHAGWRGTVAHIVRKTIAAMGTPPESLRAVIGPAISQARFEVGDEVYEAFRLAGFDMERIAKREEKWHLDLVEANRQELLSCALSADNIHTEKLCTYDNPDLFFSARREQRGTQKCGRIFSAISKL